MICQGRIGYSSNLQQGMIPTYKTLREPSSNLAKYKAELRSIVSFLTYFSLNTKFLLNTHLNTHILHYLKL